MNYEHARKMVSEAMGIVEKRLEADFGEDAWIQIETLKFDQSLCDEEDDKDGTGLYVEFRWDDPMNHGKPDGANGWDDEISIYEEDLVSAYWIAGLMYAKILTREKIF
jgi:hypothetical protein